VIKNGLQQRGMYLFEVGVAVLGAATLLLAVSDATRLYQARTAVRAAVHEGLRCLYPTDAGCAQIDPGFAAPSEQRFNVFLSNPIDGYRVAQESVQLSSSWKTAPVYEVPLTTTSLTSVTVQHAADRYVQQHVLFPAVGHKPYVVQKRPLPELGGSDPLRPSFFHPTTGKSMSPSRTVSINGIKGRTNRTAASREDEYNHRFKIGQVKFSVSDAWPSFRSDLAALKRIEREHKIEINCYQGPLASNGLLRWDASSKPEQCAYRSSNNHLFEDHKLSVPIMIHVSGRVSDVPSATNRNIQETSEPGATGKVVMTLSWSGYSKQLGGRLIDPDSRGSFVTRGASWNDIRSSSRGSYARYKAELNAHGTLALVPLDEEVTLTFMLVSTNGKAIGWSGGEVSIFFPTFDFVDQTAQCAYSRSPNNCSAPPADFRPAYAVVDRSRPLRTEDGSASQCAEVAPAEIEEDPQGRIAQLSQAIQQGRDVSALTMTVRNPGGINDCTPITRTHGCNAQLSQGVLQGCEEQRDTSNVSTLCSLNLRPGRDRITDVGVRTTTTTATSRFHACSGAPMPACARAAAREVEQVVLSVQGEGSSCPEARVSQTPLLTAGPLDVSTCGDNTASLRESYRQTHKIPASVDVTVVRYPAPDRLTQEAPTSACVRSTATVLGSGGDVTCGTNLTWAEAQRCCSEAGGNCRREQILTSRPTGGRSDSQQKLIDAAVQRAVQTTQAAYPAAQVSGQCTSGSADCLEVQGGFTDDDSSVSMSARMPVPLMLLKPFGAAGIDVEYAAERASERAFLLP
jgi:hypothetical protein